MSYSEIEKYLLENPIDRMEQNPYDLTALHLGVDKEAVRQSWRNLRRKGLVESKDIKTEDYKQKFAEEGEYREDRKDDGSVRIQDTVDRKLTDKELFERYGRNQKEWKIISVWFKDKPNGFLLSVHFAPAKIEKDLGLQKDLILKELYKESPKVNKNTYTNNRKSNKYLYELCLFDAHFGQLSWKDEVGEDYDIKIAEKRFTTAIDELLERVDLSKIEKFLLPIGNDMVAVDSNRNETFHGTRQDVDSRFFKTIQVVKRVLIENIDKLSKIAPVDVIAIFGNHDSESVFMIGEMLDAYYHNNENVTVDNSPKQRKYYEYGVNGFMYSHGNEEPHQSLGLIFATEESALWSRVKYRTCKVGHFHKTKKISYVSVDEYQGFTVMIIPSLSTNSAWTKSKGYDAIKGAKSFLYDKTNGLIGEFTFIA